VSHEAHVTGGGDGSGAAQLEQNRGRAMSSILPLTSA
jgi:hypothetical protein